MDRRAGTLPSIARRLNRLVIVSVGIALALAAAVNLWRELDRYATAKHEVLLATAHVFGSAASKAVARGDQASVFQVLRAVARMPGLLTAEVHDRDGALLADLGLSVRLASDATLDETGRTRLLDLLTSRTIQVRVPVIESGETVGRLLLVSDTTELPGQLLSALLSVLAGSGIALLLGLVLANRLRGQITRPLVALTEAMAQTARNNDYAPVPERAQDRETMLLAQTFNGMIRDIKGATDLILAREAEIIGRLSRAAEQRDDQTGQHVQRVATLSRLIAEGLDLEPQLIEDLYRASPLHDIGKIAVPDAILFKPARLNAAERAQMELHAEHGHRVLAGSNSKLVQLAAEIALTHHEHWDGSGYPQKLRGDEIPLVGRITAVADVCDALLSDRPYKKAWPLEKVRAYLIDNAGSHFDPICVAALVARWAEIAEIYRKAAALKALAKARNAA